jgi:diguanylate cyclase (GGDEF)-like protein
MAVLFIDLDGFKAVNESFGHASGDEVLREVGRRLHALAREQDTAARVGGDEFLLLMARPGSPEGAATMAQQALHALMAPYHLPGGTEVRLSCSIGIALFPEHGPTSRLIANADAAMFAVKRTGGSTYAFFEPRMELDTTDQLELQTDLRQAIERRELTLYYQPKIDARTRELTGVEALVRWQHAGRGAVGPTELIAVAERFGLIGTIGHWVIDEACRQIRAWEDQGLRMRVAVNISAYQLRQEDLVARIRQAFEAHRVDASLMTFEITESVAMEDTQVTLRAFAQLARAGVSLAIDDFGTGHSSLAYLRMLPARQLKIDRSFIHDLGLSGDAMRWGCASSPRASRPSASARSCPRWAATSSRVICSPARWTPRAWRCGRRARRARGCSWRATRRRPARHNRPRCSNQPTRRARRRGIADTLPRMRW